jgi:hypothetical protein
MAQSRKATRNLKPVRTYFLRFDGDLLFHNGCRPFTIEQIFDTGSKQEVFHQLFDDEDGWDLLQNMFECLFETAADGGDLLGCPVPDIDSDDPDNWEDTLIARFVKHYVIKGADQFFKDIDKTWVRREIDSYAFVRSDEMEKLLTVMMNCARDSAVEDQNTQHLDPDEYFHRPPRKKRSKKNKAKLLA